MTEEPVAFRTRFMAQVDTKLREQVNRKGELVQLIILILKTVDLQTIPLLEISSDLQALAVTTVKLPVKLHAKLKSVAEKRNSSMNRLVNSAVWAYTKKKTESDK